MNIGKIAPTVKQSVSSGMLQLGRKVQNKGSFASKANRFMEGRGPNVGHGAFLAMIYVCTLVPRFLKARDNDERMEIVRRDLITITTICFAMKALSAAACKATAKKSGLPMTTSSLPKDANPLRKALGYFQQKGETAFTADELSANYSNIDGKNMITRFLNFVDENKGDVGKVLTFDKANPNAMFNKRPEDGALTKASKRLLGNDYDFTKPGKEILADIQKIDEKNPGFKEISNALKDNDSNPIAKFSKGLSSKFEIASLGAVTAFLGFGLPKLNEKLTKDKYFNNKDGGQLKPTYQNPNYPMPTYSVYKTMNAHQKTTFQNFLGNYNSPYANSGNSQTQQNAKLNQSA